MWVHLHQFLVILRKDEERTWEAYVVATEKLTFAVDNTCPYQGTTCPNTFVEGGYIHGSTFQTCEMHNLDSKIASTLQTRFKFEIE